MRFTFILLLMSNLKNVHGSFKKDCKHGLDLIGFDELDGKYKQVNSIYYKDDNTSKAFEVHLNDTCHWELESNILPFPKYECKTQCLDILSCTGGCINLIDCDVWEKKYENHTSLITPIVKRSRCINISLYFLVIFQITLIILILACIRFESIKGRKKKDAEHAERVANMERINTEHEEILEIVRESRIDV